jgi:cell division inhibitor SepF
MDFPNPSRSAGNLLGGLKDRFGLGNREPESESYDEPYVDDYVDEADFAPIEGDYGPYAYDPAYDDGFVEEGFHDEVRQYDSMNAGIRRPKLVTSEDIRLNSNGLGVAARSSYGSGTTAHDGFAATQPSANHLGSSAAEAAPARDQRTVSFGSLEREPERARTSYGDFVSPYQEQRSAGATQVIEPDATRPLASTGSAGLDGLFQPTTHARELRLFRPASYEDVAELASVVKAGDIAVLVLRATDASLARRLTDFCFGVASACEAQVDWVADKVFVVAKGDGITQEEKRDLDQLL